MKRCLALLLPLALVACQDASEPLSPSSEPSTDVAALQAPAGQAVPGQYIVVLDAGANPRAVAAVAGVTPRHVYEHALTGFSASLNQGQLRALQAMNAVRYVEQDQVMYAIGTQSNATWGIDRIDQRELPLNDSYTYPNTASSVHAYIIDTGIRVTHTEFGGRAVHGYDAVDNDFDATDCNGHGTHVAGTVGGSTYGVAKNVTLVGVRVLDCQGSGTNSGVIAGVDWVTANAVKPAVANMSLGGGASSALDDAVRRSINSGVTYALAAGNGDFLGRPADACNGSPSRVLEALTVGATDSTDVEASFSNYGTCVDLLAPGVKITSAWYQSNTQLNTISGTSMATPHVAGVAALYLESNIGASPAQVASALTGNASTNKITLHSRSSSSGTPNLLLYTGFIGGGSEPPPRANNPPTAGFSYTTSGLTAKFTDGSTDSDGTITQWSWDFGDGSTSSAQNPSHSYAAAGTYSVKLTVMDDDGATASETKSVSVSDGSGTTSPSNLSATGYKVKGRHTVDLSWTKGSASKVDIFRNGSKIKSGISNTGSYTDNINQRGSGTYTYKVCVAGDASSCSNTSTVTF